MTKQELDSAIVADLKDPSLTHAYISSKHRVGMTRIITLAREHGLTRPRGRKPRDEQAQVQE
jgi:hypothetical protein